MKALPLEKIGGHIALLSTLIHLSESKKNGKLKIMIFKITFWQMLSLSSCIFDEQNKKDEML